MGPLTTATGRFWPFPLFGLLFFKLPSACLPQWSWGESLFCQFADRKRVGWLRATGHSCALLEYRRKGPRGISTLSWLGLGLDPAMPPLLLAGSRAWKVGTPTSISPLIRSTTTTARSRTGLLTAAVLSRSLLCTPRSNCTLGSIILLSRFFFLFLFFLVCSLALAGASYTSPRKMT